jgi:prepilin-type N-terminal cleavage/methylation domain-containing protein
MRSTSRGFTLVELIVAVGITAALAAIMLVIVTNLLSTASRSSGSLVTNNQAGFALDRIAEDIEEMILRPDGNIAAAVTLLDLSTDGVSLTQRGWILGTKPSEFELDSNNLSECRFGAAGVWLRFVTMAGEMDDDDGDPDTAEVWISNPVAVGYQIVRRRVTENPNSGLRYMLYRAEIPPPATFAAGYELDPTKPAAEVPYNAIDSANLGAPGNMATPHIEQMLIADAIDFGVRLLGPRLDGLPGLERIWPQSDSGPAAYFVQSGATRFPTHVEVVLRVLTPEGGRILEEFERGTIPGDWWEIAEQHSQVYTRVVPIRGRPM